MDSALKNFPRAMRDTDEGENKKAEGPQDSLSGKSDSATDAEFSQTGEQHSGDHRG